MKDDDKNDLNVLERSKSQFDRNNSSRFSNIISIITLIVASSALLVSWLQSGIYQKQLMATQKQIEDAEIQNKLQNSVNEDQLKNSKDQDRRQSRAYLGTKSVHILHIAVPNKMSFQYFLQNFGNSKAKEVNFLYDYDLTPLDKNSIYTRSVDWVDNLKIDDDVYQGSTTFFPKDIQFNQTDMEKAKYPDTVLVIYGKLTYKDIFDNNHETHFCFEIRHDIITKFFAHKDIDDSEILYCTNLNSGD